MISPLFSRALILSIIALVLLTAACSDDAESGDEGLIAVTSSPLLADMVTQVAGDRVSVESLLPPGADPHTWEPSPSDIATLEDADIAFANGADLDPTALELMNDNTPEGTPVIVLSEAGDFPGAGDDPHLWMNPDNAMSYAAIIRQELAAIDPEGEDAYAAGLDAFVAEIIEADRYLLEAAESVPADHRKLITTHDAFGYLADEIGFEIAAFVTPGPGQDASPDNIQAVVEAVEDQGVPAVFTEPQVSGESETLEQVAEDTGAEVCTLYSDAFDDKVTTYLQLLRHNADEIARCLGGQNGE